MSGIIFASPWLLLGLIALPLIWWLLRVTPPRPNQELFPPFELLKQLFSKEETPHKSPWWLTLIRLLMAGLIVVALARPILNPNVVAPIEGDYLALVVDNGWAAQTEWSGIQQTAEAVLERAGDDNIPVFLAFSAADGREPIGPFSASQALERLRAVEPQGVSNNRAASISRIVRGLEESQISLATTHLTFITDGTEADMQTASERLAAFEGRIALYGPNGVLPPALLTTNNGSDQFTVRVANADATRPLILRAKDDKGRVIAEAELGAGAQEAAFDVPFALRNDFAQIDIKDQNHAGATYLLDESNRRRRIGLLASSNVEDGQPLLAPLYYIDRALAPIADLIVPEEATFEDNLTAVLEAVPSVIILADIGRIDERAESQLTEWLNAGGTLIRFAGPRLAASVTPSQDPLLPVILRQGERSLGGALSWSEPQKLVAFPEQSPFAGLALPRDVTVSRQVLAQPSADILERSWAVLEDGTPLVTGNAVGEGSLVLFHVSSEATWSNLPISGSFVDLLTRLTRLSKGRVSTASKTDNAEANLAAWRVLNGKGILEEPQRAIDVLPQSALNEAPNFAAPPGLYGSADGFVAFNLFSEDRSPLPLSTSLEGITPQVLISDAAEPLSGFAWLAAMLLFLMDCLAMLFLSGGFSRLKPNMRASLSSVLILLALGTMVLPNQSVAQAISAEDQAIIDSLSVTRLAYVITGNDRVDQVSREGLEGLTRFLSFGTSVEPGPPIGVDLENDILSFYPMLYYPIETETSLPSRASMAKLESYMRQGGTVLFDTRDGLQTGFGGQSAEGQRLRDMVQGLDIPPLETVPENHVLRRSFYIIQSFPGRYANAPLWVEAQPEQDASLDRPVRRGDGVSSILITGNDLAAAWAIDEAGVPLYVTVPPEPLQREYAFRAGVNIVMYMLTGNYKADQVHIPALLERLGQ